jgi:predicted transcriptional regulator YdeE
VQCALSVKRRCGVILCIWSPAKAPPAKILPCAPVASREIALGWLAFRGRPWQRKCHKQPAKNVGQPPRWLDAGAGRRAMFMQSVVVATDAFLVVGVKTRTTHRIEAVSQTARIPALWRRFFVDNVSAKIPERLSAADIVAVYTGYENDDRGPYCLLIGRKVGNLDQTPQGMAGVLVPGGRYLCFTANGPSPETPITAWQEIRQFFALSHEYERAYTVDFEVHHPDEIEIYVAVK